MYLSCVFSYLDGHFRVYRVQGQNKIEILMYSKNSTFKARGGGSGIIFACLARMKVPFIAEKTLFVERSYPAVSKNY